MGYNRYMQDNLKFIEKELDKKQAEATAARRQAETERQKASMYDNDVSPGNSDVHANQAKKYDEQADQLEDEIQAMQPKKDEIISKVTQLKAEREKINREVVDKTYAIDKELERLLGGLTI